MKSTLPERERTFVRLTARMTYDQNKHLLLPDNMKLLDITQQRQLLKDFKNLELALCREEYSTYVQFVHEGRWIPGKVHVFLCNTVQDFLKRKTGHPYDILLLSVPPQSGKALHVETPVLTTEGWKKHGELTRGDVVYNHQGNPVRVLAVQKPYEHPCVKLTLDTAEEFVCAREHEWVIEANRDKRTPDGKRIGRQKELLEAQHIFDNYHSKSPAIRVSLPLQNSDSATLPIDPYILGIWLGNGTECSGDVTIGLQDLEHYKKMFTRIIVRDRCAPVKTEVINQTKLKTWGLYKNKHIPSEYFFASEQQRMELLRGLMDTDGYVSMTGSCEYTSIDKKLAEDVLFLLRTLGFKSQMGIGDAKINGIFISKKYRVLFMPNKTDEVCGLERKMNRVRNKKPDRDDKKLYFVQSVVPCENCFVNCITVEGGMYLAGTGLIPTHNSMTVTETLPSWYLGQFPLSRVIIASYNEELARQFGRRNKEKIVKFGKQIFGVALSAKKTADDNFELMNGIGVLRSRGMMSGITGNPANLFIVDDPVKGREEADSIAFRDKQWEVWQNQIKARLAAGAKVIVIQTRWHEDDLYGRIELNEKFVTKINIPCEAETDDILGRNAGDALAPEIGKDNNWLREFKRSYIEDANTGGKRAWYALYQGRPFIEGGTLIQEQWFNYWQPKGWSLPPVIVKDGDGNLYERVPVELPEYLDERVQSWDFTFRKTKEGDFVAGGVWGRRLNYYYKLDAVHKRMDIVETMKEMERLNQKWPDCSVILVEAKANGDAILALLQQKIGRLLPTEPDRDKAARVRVVLGALEAGNVYLPHPLLKDYAWVHEMLTECIVFPNAEHDDYVDEMSQALTRLMQNPTDTNVTSMPQGMFRTEREKLDMGYAAAGDSYDPYNRQNTRKATVI